MVFFCSRSIQLSLKNRFWDSEATKNKTSKVECLTSSRVFVRVPVLKMVISKVFVHCWSVWILWVCGRCKMGWASCTRLARLVSAWNLLLIFFDIAGNSLLNNALVLKHNFSLLIYYYSNIILCFFYLYLCCEWKFRPLGQMIVICKSAAQTIICRYSFRVFWIFLCVLKISSL